MAAKVNNYLNNDHSSDSSSDEDESCCEKNSSTQMQDSFSKSDKHKLLRSSKSMDEPCSHIQSLGQFEKFRPNIVMFAQSSLSILNSVLPSKKESFNLNSVLANYNRVRVDSAPNGNCFFESVTYVLEHSVISNSSTSNHVVQHLNALGLIKRKWQDWHLCTSKKASWWRVVKSFRFLQAISHSYSDIWSGSKSIFEEWTLCSWFRQFNASGNGKCTVFANRCYDRWKIYQYCQLLQGIV